MNRARMLVTVLASQGGPVDTTAPTCVITSAASGTTITTFTCTFTFSEDVTGFVLGDITVGNGTAGTFNAVSGSVYTAVITPTATGTVTVDVAAEVCQDAAGNLNEASNTFSILRITADVWFDFSDLTTLFQDSARSTAITADDDPIGGVADKSGAGHHGSASLTTRALYKTAIVNSKSVARFDGVNDRLNFTISASAAYTLFVVTQKRSAAGAASQPVYCHGDSGAAVLYTKTGDGAGFLWYANQAGGVKSFGGAPTSVNLLCIKFTDATAAQGYINAAAAGAAYDPGNSYNTTAAALGTNRTGTQEVWGDYDVCELLLFTSALSDAARGAVEAYLDAKWALPFDIPGVVLTFDDGYAAWYPAYEYAIARGVKASGYVKTNKPGTAGDGTGVGAPTWAELAEMEAGGWDFGSHTHTHPDLTTLTQEQIETELSTAKSTLIANGITRAVDHFAYPFGAGYNDADTLAAMAAQGVLTARKADSSSPGTVPETVEPYLLVPYFLDAAQVTAANVITNIQSVVVTGGKYQIFGLHDIGDEGLYAWSWDNWHTLVDWLAANNIPTYTISEFYAIMAALGNP